MDIQNIMKIMDASHRTRQIIERSLHDIDRRALNAMVLVKRHGTKLAGYGVVAQAFREQAALLKEAASPLQHSIAPLVRAHMRILQQHRYADMCRRTVQTGRRNRAPNTFFRPEKSWNEMISAEEAAALVILRDIVHTVVRLQEGIAEQEYVVTNGRIEAALSERSGAPLMRVSQEMGAAVATVRDAIREYRNQLEEVLHEGSASL